MRSSLVVKGKTSWKLDATQFVRPKAARTSLLNRTNCVAKSTTKAHSTHTINICVTTYHIHDNIIIHSIVVFISTHCRSYLIAEETSALTDLSVWQHFNSPSPSEIGVAAVKDTRFYNWILDTGF